MKAHEIRYTETLDYCDGIQLFTAEDATGGNYVAALVGLGEEADQYVVVGCEPENLGIFRSGAIDLKTLMERSAKRGWYLADVADFGVPFSMSLQPGTVIPKNLLPGDGMYLDEIQPDDVELVNDSDIETDIERRIQTALMVAELGGATAAVAALLKLDEGITWSPYTGYESRYHIEIARAVAKLGDAESAVRILVAVCEGDDLGREERCEAAQEVMRMGDTLAGVSGYKAVLYFANEYGVRMDFDEEAEYRIKSAKRMAEAGKIAEAVTVLKVITESGGDEYDYSDRRNAAVTLSKIGDDAAAAKAFLSLAVDDDLDAEDQDRLDAALKVAELGDWEMAMEALLSVAEDCDREEVRLKAAIEVASFMDDGAEPAIAIIGGLLSWRYSSHQLMDARMERDLAVDDQTPSIPPATTMTDQEKAWALILEAAKILYPRAFAG